MTLDAPRGSIPIGVARFNPDRRNGLRMALEPFAINLSGVLSFPDVMGNGFAVTLANLEISEAGVSFGDVDLGGQAQEVDLANDLLRFRFTEVDLDYRDSVLNLGLEGLLWFKPFQNVEDDDDAVQFTGFTVNTAGDLDWGEAQVNLLAGGRKIHILGDEGAERVYLDDLRLSAAEGELQIEARGAISLPEPLASQEQRFRFAVDRRGVVTGDLRFRFGNGRNVLRDNPDTEFALPGDIATIDLKEVGLNLDDLRRPVLFFNASVYLNNDTGQVIQLGTVGQSGDQAGFYYPLGGDPSWNVSARGLSAEIDFGMLRMAIAGEQVRTSGANFGLTLGGQVALAHPGVEGEVGWDGLTISARGLQSVGSPDAAGGASFTLMNIVTLGVGSFAMGSGRLNLGDRTVTTTSHLRLTDAHLSLTEAIQGSVTEVLFYRVANGDFFLNIRGVDIDLGGNGDGFRLSASLDYESEGGGYVLRAAGRTEAGGVELAVAGIIRNRGGLSFGLFAALESDVGIPIIPGVLTLNGVGGGFFYRPTREDIGFVTQERVIGFSLNGAQPDPGQLRFAVLLYGSASMLGGALEIDALVQITDRYTKVDADGFFYSPTFLAEMFLTVEYSDGILVHGGVAVVVDSPVLTGGASLDFFIAYQGSLRWAVLGRINNFELLFIRARGQFMISSNGFLVDLAVGGSIDFKIITIRGSFEASVWAIQGQSWGAYAEIDIRASVLGGAAKIGANLKGAIIIDDGYLLYASASAYVEVLWVFEGRVSVWLSLENGDFDGGTGRNRGFEALIAEARGQRDAIQRQAEATRQSLGDAFADLNSFALTPEQLRQAGYTLLMADAGERRRFGDYAVQAELDFLNGAEDGDLWDLNRDGNEDAQDRQMWRTLKNQARATFEEVNERLISAEAGRPGLGEVETAQSAVQASMEGLEAVRDEVAERFQDLQMGAIQFREDAEEAELSIRNPLQVNWPRAENAGGGNRRISWGEGALFSVDSRANAANAGALLEAKEAAGTIEQRYREVIAVVQGNLETLDAMIMSRQVFEGMGAVYTDPFTGNRADLGRMVDRNNLNDFAEMYFQTYEQTGEYFARYARHLWELREWAVEQQSVFRGRRFGMRGVIQTTRTGLHMKRNGYQIGRNLAFNRKLLTRLLLAGCTLACPDRETFDEADDAASTFRGELDVLLADGARGQFANEFQQAGVEFWQALIQRGLEAVLDTTEARIALLRGQYEAQLSNIGTDHRGITDRIQRLYVERSNLAATLLGMVDQYVAWREGIVDEAAGGAAGFAGGAQNKPSVGLLAVRLINNPYSALRNQLAASLDPPVLSNPRAQTTEPDFATRSTITWTARHPQGVIETSFDISSGGRYPLRGSGLRSVGSRRSIEHWSFMPQRIFGTSDTYDLTLRARSVSGTTTLRRASFRVAYTPGADWGRDDGADISVVDNTPPTPPVIVFPEHRRYGQWQDIAGRPFNAGDAYWGTQTNSVTMNLASVDLETDVSAFEVAIGTRRGGTDTQEWAVVYGERLLQGNSANSLVRATIWGLDLVPGRRYYVSARARNGEGNLSRISRAALPLIIDNTPPGDPGHPARGLPQFDLPGRVPPVQLRWPVYREAPAVRQDPAPARVPATLGVAWTGSQDDESGLRMYQYALHQQAQPGPGAFDGQIYRTRETGVTLTERSRFGDRTRLSYGATVYVSIRALNNAGGYSATLVRGPYTVTDSSPPTRPKASARWYRHVNKVYLTSVSVDPESDIEKYQYAFGTVAGRNDLQGWRDVPVDRLRTSGGAAPYFSTTGQGAPPGQPYYVNVRAVNGQGAASRTIATGPVTIDNSSAPRPDINLSFADNELRMEFSDVGDPESGLLQFEYKIAWQGLNGSRTLVNWTSYLRFVRPFTIELNRLVRRVRLNPPEGGLSLRVSVRLTNGYGLRRTYTADHSLVNRFGGVQFIFNE